MAALQQSKGRWFDSGSSDFFFTFFSILFFSIMSVFVTVGTTQFNDLIETVSTNEVLSLLEKNHFHKVVIQKGNGPFVPDEQLFSKYNV